MHGENYPLRIKQARNETLNLQTDKPEIYPSIKDIDPPTPDPQNPEPDITTAVARPPEGPVCPPKSLGQLSYKSQGSRPTRTHKILKYLSDFELNSD